MKHIRSETKYWVEGSDIQLSIKKQKEIIDYIAFKEKNSEETNGFTQKSSEQYPIQMAFQHYKHYIDFVKQKKTR